MPSFYTHFKAVYDSLGNQIKPDLLPYVMAGAIFPDNFVFRDGHENISRDIHTLNDKDRYAFSNALYKNASTLEEKAFAFGAETHAVVDSVMHPVVDKISAEMKHFRLELMAVVAAMKSSPVKELHVDFRDHIKDYGAKKLLHHFRLEFGFDYFLLFDQPELGETKTELPESLEFIAKTFLEKYDVRVTDDDIHHAYDVASDARDYMLDAKSKFGFGYAIKSKSDRRKFKKARRAEGIKHLLKMDHKRYLLIHPHEFGKDDYKEQLDLALDTAEIELVKSGLLTDELKK